MELKLIRDTFTPNSTIGRLFVDGKYHSYILEDVRRADGVKVHGATCIPSGTYKVIVTFSNHFQRDLPLLVNVPNFSGIRIHSGNAPKDTEGCLLPGFTKAIDFVGQSRAAFDPLMRKIQAAILNSEEIEIEITEQR